MNLAQGYEKGRDNNFNLIRMIAALAVLISHSFALASGDPNTEPLRAWLGVTPGSLAVDIFFVTSGFLVTGSLLKSGDIPDFIVARVLRIYPALLVMTLMTACVLGPALTTSSLNAYFHSPLITQYLLKNSTLVADVTFKLPGVFLNNPYPSAVNGSLWTLPFEVWMYLTLALFALGSISLGRRKMDALKFLITLVCVASGLDYFRHLAGLARHPTSDLSHLTFMFFSGAVYFINRRRVNLSPRIFLLLLVALCLSTINRIAFNAVLPLAIGYLIFFVAYVPNGVARGYRRAGDYSYGVYIYAYPIQQLIVASFPGVSAIGVLAGSAGLTLPCAIASWHFIEKRALTLKKRLIRAKSVPAL